MKQEERHAGELVDSSDDEGNAIKVEDLPFPSRELPEALAEEVGRTVIEVCEKNPINYFAYCMVFTSTLEEAVAAFGDEDMRVAVIAECRHLMVGTIFFCHFENFGTY